jgi:M6 family metalloprotease-like protein
LRRYWSEVSYGAMNINGSTARDWKVLPEPRSGYVDIVTIDGQQYWDANLDKLYEHCMALHDPDVNFAAGSGVYGIMMAFNEELDGPAWGGTRCEVRDGVDACRGVVWMPPWGMEQLAVVAHEMGHGYGLPHVDNSDRDGTTYDNPWDVMSSSQTYNYIDGGYGRYPKQINAYNRDLLGWIPEARVRTVVPGEGPVTVMLDRLNLPVSSNTRMLVLRDPGRSDRRYILETRTRSGFYDINLPGDGVIIYEVEDGRSSPSWSQDADVPPADFSSNEGSMFKPGETWASPDHLFRVRVDAVTESGFQLTVLPIPRKSGPHPALRVETPAPVSAPAAPAPVRTPAAGPAPRRDRR